MFTEVEATERQREGEKSVATSYTEKECFVINTIIILNVENLECWTIIPTQCVANMLQ